jgi:hypothetical protein
MIDEYFTTKSRIDMNQAEEDALIAVGTIVEKYGTQIREFKIFEDPDMTFWAQESAEFFTVTLREGEARGDIVFYYDKFNHKVDIFEPGPWLDRIEATLKDPDFESPEQVARRLLLGEV